MPLAKLKNININYRVEGRGEPLLMIMGFSAPMIGWYFQTHFFKKSNCVITFDNRGVGKSDKPQGPYTTKMMADDTIHLMDYLGIDKTHIIGASMGGMIAQEVAINYPERVKKLVLACTYAKQDESSITLNMRTLSKQTVKKMTVRVINLGFNKPHYRLIFSLLGWINSIFMESSTSIGIKGQSMACMNHNTLDRLGLITAETLVIVGADDRLINPVSSEVISKNIPGARLVKVRNGSHTFMVEMRDAFNQEVLNFLSSSGSGYMSRELEFVA
jgi:pimeloyl-ACP methyl ester carboxylesterase